MRNSVLPVMTVLSVVAGAVGLQLGESAIAAIDPVYFQGPAIPARDVTAAPRPHALAGFSQASGWAEGYAARAADCGNCPIMPERAAHAPPAPIYASSDYEVAPFWEPAESEAAADEVRIERSIESARVNRYLHYPVSADQEQVRASAEDSLPPEPMTVEAPTKS